VLTICRKAGVPAADVRGNITSHRARSTIASQLYNAKEPMTLFELQAWLGHRSPQSTQFYAKISPATLTRAYDDAGYFSRNVRTIEVLVDRDAVTSGAAAAGEPWQHYDLGRLSRTGLDEVLIEAISDMEAPSAEDELHCHGFGRQIGA
jgi:hypothetical protein